MVKATITTDIAGFSHGPLARKQNGITKETGTKRDFSTRRYILGFSAFAVIVFVL
jgi:hypothetical protein